MRLFPPFNKFDKIAAQKKFAPILDKWNKKNPNQKKIFFIYSPKRHKMIKIYL
jgi:hypothetical protein